MYLSSENLLKLFLKKNNLDKSDNNDNDNRVLTLKGKEHLYMLNAIIL